MKYLKVKDPETGLEYGRKRVYERGDGIRRRFHTLLDQQSFENPKRMSSKHPPRWYLDGHLSSRPVYGVYAMARLAEHYLYYARYGKRQQAQVFPDAARFYASTRRALQNVLSTFGIDKRIPHDKVALVRDIYEQLRNEAAVLNEIFSNTTGHRVKPFDKKLTKKDLELLEAILVEQSRNGTIPKTSALFRETPLTPSTVI